MGSNALRFLDLVDLNSDCHYFPSTPRSALAFPTETEAFGALPRNDLRHYPFLLPALQQKAGTSASLAMGESRTWEVPSRPALSRLPLGGSGPRPGRLAYRPLVTTKLDFARQRRPARVRVTHAKTATEPNFVVSHKIIHFGTAVQTREGRWPGVPKRKAASLWAKRESPDIAVYANNKGTKLKQLPNSSETEPTIGPWQRAHCFTVVQSSFISPIIVYCVANQRQ